MMSLWIENCDEITNSYTEMVFVTLDEFEPAGHNNMCWWITGSVNSSEESSSAASSAGKCLQIIHITFNTETL